MEIGIISEGFTDQIVLENIITNLPKNQTKTLKK